MSETVKKETTRKKSAANPADADSSKAVAEEMAKAVKKAPAKKAADKKKAAEIVEAPEPEVKVPKAAAKTTKAKAELPPESVEVSEAEEAQTVDAPAPKRKYTKRKTADAELEAAETENVADAAASAPAKKTTRKSKKAVEVVLPEDENAVIEEKIFNLIRGSPNGVHQSEVWKIMNIDSRKCSRLLKKLLDSEKILREEAVVSGTKTYLLKKMTEGAKKNYDVLMVRDMFSPCTGCMGECRPEYCPALTFWIMNISETPEDYYAAMGYNSQAEPESEAQEFPPEFIEEMGTEAGNLEYAEEEDDLVFE